MLVKNVTLEAIFKIIHQLHEKINILVQKFKHY
jgi:hypothetical protein